MLLVATFVASIRCFCRNFTKKEIKMNNRKKRAIILAAVLAVVMLGTVKAIIKTHSTRGTQERQKAVQEADSSQEIELAVLTYHDVGQSEVHYADYDTSHETSWSRPIEATSRGIYPENVKAFKFGSSPDPALILLFGAGLAIMAFACFFYSKT